MKKYLMFLSVGVAFVLFPSWSQAATLYAKTGGVKVTAETSPTSSVVGTLEEGDAVEVLKQDGRKLYVKIPSGKTGWVFQFKLTDSKPSSSSGGSSALSGLTGKSTIAARESRAGGSIRGLKETTANYARDKRIDPVYQRAVDAMEARVVTRDELAAFQRDGKIGEFSGGDQ